jgi:hypothetical protein
LLNFILLPEDIYNINPSLTIKNTMLLLLLLLLLWHYAPLSLNLPSLATDPHSALSQALFFGALNIIFDRDEVDAPMPKTQPRIPGPHFELLFGRDIEEHSLSFGFAETCLPPQPAT